MNSLSLVVNSMVRHINPALAALLMPTHKHNYELDFGYPDRVSFKELYAAFCRYPLARAAVNKTIDKTWQENPLLQEFQRDGTEKGDQGETELEAEIRKRFAKLRLWQHMAEADRRSMVGRYSGLILRLADGKPFGQPVDRVGGGLEGLVDVVPAWEGQLTVSEWDTVETSPDYGQPKMYQFSEASIGEAKQPRQFLVHPDRVIIFSRDGTLFGQSNLEAGYNALLDMEKIRGGGGEGFWKNAKSGLSIEIDKDAKLSDMARSMGVEPSDVVDSIENQVGDFNRGFDQSLLTQGMTVKPIQVTLPSPEHFFTIAAQSFAASQGIPMKVLVGSQSGERASTEDNAEWSRTNMARRNNQIVPTAMEMVERLVTFGILPAGKDWYLDWPDLTEATIAEKVDRAEKMASTNQKQGETVFTVDDIRSAVGMEPLSDADRFRDEAEDEDDTEDEVPPSGTEDPQDTRKQEAERA